MEAAAYFHLSPESWRLHTADDRARMVAHTLIKSIREAFVMEQVSDSAKPPRELNDYEKQKIAMAARLAQSKV